MKPSEAVNRFFTDNDANSNTEAFALSFHIATGCP